MRAKGKSDVILQVAKAMRKHGYTRVVIARAQPGTGKLRGYPLASRDPDVFDSLQKIDRR